MLDSNNGSGAAQGQGQQQGWSATKWIWTAAVLSNQGQWIEDGPLRMISSEKWNRLWQAQHGKRVRPSLSAAEVTEPQELRTKDGFAI